jgi:hypothetical protein
VFPGARLGRHVSRLYVAPQPARQHPHRTQPSYSAYHPVGADRRALCGAQQPDWVRDSQRKIFSLSPGKRLHHQRSSRHAMVPLSDTSTHPKGEKPAKDPLNSAFLDGVLPAPLAARGAPHSSFGTEMILLAARAVNRKTEAGRVSKPSHVAPLSVFTGLTVN